MKARTSTAKAVPAATAANTTIEPIAVSELPPIGAPLGGGTFAGIARGEKSEPDYAIVVLADDAPKLKWKAALAWAEKLGCSLPSRDEARICYANLRDAFERDWYWTCEQFAGYESFAWFQYFGTGLQLLNLKDDELRARAVRRLPIR